MNNKRYEMQHFTTLKILLASLSKHFIQISRRQSKMAVTGGGMNIFSRRQKAALYRLKTKYKYTCNHTNVCFISCSNK